MPYRDSYYARCPGAVLDYYEGYCPRAAAQMVEREVRFLPAR